MRHSEFCPQFSSVAQLCLTLCNPMDDSPPGSCVHGILQARILEWVAICQYWKIPGDLPNPGMEPRSPAFQADPIHFPNIPFSSVQSSSVAQSCLTLCDPMNHSMPGLPVHHQILEFTQTHVHRVSDAIQPSHHLSSPSPPAPNPSQHQSLFR